MNFAEERIFHEKLTILVITKIVEMVCTVYIATPANKQNQSNDRKEKMQRNFEAHSVREPDKKIATTTFH
jgi:hypothetical protein